MLGMNTEEITIKAKTSGSVTEERGSIDYGSTCNSIINILRDFNESAQNVILRNVINSLIEEKEIYISDALKEIEIRQAHLQNLKKIFNYDK